jgi:protein PsiE
MGTDNDPSPGLTKTATDPATPKVSRDEEALVVGGFRLIERGLLVAIALMTVVAAAAEVWGVVGLRKIDLADILLMFLYTEVIGMIAVFYTGRGSPFTYPIFIAITALSRLIVLQGKEMKPENIVFEAGAILVLAIAVVVIVRAGKS